MSIPVYEPLAHNTETSGNGAAPVVIERPSATHPAASDRENWHVATGEELDRYAAYWDAQQD